MDSMNFSGFELRADVQGIAERVKTRCSRDFDLFLYTYHSLYPQRAKLCNIRLEKVSIIKDLGIFMDSIIHFDVHINHIIDKAFKMYHLVMRTAIPFKRPNSYILLYNSLIRSYLEYATYVWNPLYSKYHDQLESVQKKFLKTMNYRCFRSNVHMTSF
jgi:hypothetical protein